MLTQVASLICRNFRLCQFSFVVLFCDATKVIYWKEIILAKEPTRLVMVDKMFFLKEIFLTTFHTFQNNKKGGLSLLVSINPLSFGLTFLECFYHNLRIKLIRTKRSERAKRAHSGLREVEKMGYKKFSPVPV